MRDIVGYFSPNSEIEVKIVFDRYNQQALERFTKELNALAEKWKLNTKTTTLTVREQSIRLSKKF